MLLAGLLLLLARLRIKVAIVLYTPCELRVVCENI